MADLATLGLAVDSGPVKAATSALRDFREEGARTEKQITNTAAAMAKGKPGAKEFAEGLNSANTQSQNFSKGTNKVIESLNTQFVRLNTTEKQWRILQNVQKAGVSLASQEGAHIAKITGALYDMEQAQAKASAGGSLFNKVLGGSQVVAALGLFGIGFTQVFAAAKQLYDYLELAGPSTEKLLKEQDRLIGIVKASYDEATKSAKNFYEQSKDVTRLQLLQQEIDLQRKLREEVGKGISNSTTFGGIGDFFSGTRQVKEQFQAFEDAIFRLKDGFDQGAPNVRAFADEVARIGLQNPELQKAAIDLIKNVGSASELAEKLKAIRSSLDLLDGKKLNNEGRASIGLSPDRSGENLASAWDKQLASLSRRNAAMEAEARTVGQSEAAHEKMRTTLMLEDFLINKGVKDLEAYRTQIEKAGDEAAKTADKLARARIGDQITFDRKTAFLTQEDVQIASQLRSIYGNDIPAALSSTEAAAMRTNNTLRQLSDLGQEVNRGLFVEFGQQIRNGASAWDAFRTAGTNALGKIADKLMAMAADQLWASAFGGANAGASGGLLGSVFSGIGKLFAAADGGTFGPGWGIVGERGPELINVHSRGVTVVPNHISKPYLPGFAEGGMLSASGNVTRLPFGQNNAPAPAQIINNYDFRGADPSMKGWIKAQIKIAQDQTLKATPGYTAKVDRDRPGMRGRG